MRCDMDDRDLIFNHCLEIAKLQKVYFDEAQMLRKNNPMSEADIRRVAELWKISDDIAEAYCKANPLPDCKCGFPRSIAFQVGRCKNFKNCDNAATLR